MSSVARFPILAALVATLAAPLLTAADGALASQPPPKASYILIGFAGGFIHHDDPNHGPVQLAHRVQPDLPQDASIQIFENRHRRSAYDAILRRLDSDHDGNLSAAEKAQARIILFGHSWGASAVVMLALPTLTVPVLVSAPPIFSVLPPEPVPSRSRLPALLTNVVTVSVPPAF